MTPACPPEWLVAPVSMHETARRRQRPSQAKPPQVLRLLGTHGRYHIQIIRSRGKPQLLYRLDSATRL